jgi:hypothetical protein
MTAIEMTEKVQDGVLKAIETSQSWTLGALRSTSSAFDTLKPDASRIPFADRVPSPAEAIEATFGFWGKLLDAQHSFVSGITEIYATPTGTAATKKS